MKFDNYYTLFFTNIENYFGIYIVIFLIYFLLLRKYIFGFLDVFFFENIISSSFATTTVIFLFMHDKIDSYYLNVYLSSLLCFWVMFLFVAKKVPNKMKTSASRQVVISQRVVLPRTFFILFLLFSQINIIFTLINYVSFGIPIFMESRLVVNMEAGIVNAVVVRLHGILSTITNLIMFYIIFFGNKRQRIYSKLYFFILLIFSFLSGSKSGLLSIFFVFTSFAYLIQLQSNKYMTILRSKKIYLLLFVIVISGLTVVIIQSKANLVKAVSSLILRFSSYGDAYVYAYPKGIIEKVSKQNIFYFLFGDFLSTFRLLPRTIGFGFELKNIVYNISSSVTGPNPRLNLVGYAYFGFVGNLILCTLSGYLLASIRNMFIFAPQRKSIFYHVFSYYFMMLVISIETDVLLIVSNLTTNIILQTIFFLTIYLLMNSSKESVNSNIVKNNI